jgi:protein-tyrosine phosphatase
MKISVLFVCLGNICRSPTAHGLFQYYVDQANLADSILVDSPGTGNWHEGEAPDSRAQLVALNKGYNISHLRGRSVKSNDFLSFDYMLAMDNQNLHFLESMKPDNYYGELGLFLKIANNGVEDCSTDYKITQVPDPFYGDSAHFEKAIALMDRGSKNLLAKIREKNDL